MPRSRRRSLRLLRHDPGVRIGDDPEDVHQARVATRRLRSDLRTFRDAARSRLERDAPRRAAVARRRSWERCATPRCCIDRVRDRIDAASARGPIRRRPLLVQTLLERWDEARAELLAAMRSARYHRCSTASSPPPENRRCSRERRSRHRRRAAARSSAARGSHLRNAVEGLDDDPPDDALHEVRIRAKRCRYAAEAVAAVAGKPAREFAKAIADVQEVLGEHQDAVVAEQWLRDTSAGPTDAREVFVAGELTALERDAAHRAREAWPEVLARSQSQAPPRLAVSRTRRPSSGPRAASCGGAGTERPRGAASSTGPATTTGACPRARPIPASATRTPPGGRSRRRPACACRLGPELSSTSYVDRKGRPKVVRYWLMTPMDPAADQGEFVPNEEIDEVRWCSAADAGKLLTHAHDRSLIAEAEGLR